MGAVNRSALNSPKIGHPCGFLDELGMRNLQDFEIIDSVFCKLREGFNGSEAANAPDSRVIPATAF